MSECWKGISLVHHFFFVGHANYLHLPSLLPLTDISINMVGAKKLKHTFMIIVTFQSCEHSYRVTWLTYQMAIRLSVRFGPLVPGVAFLFITPSCIRWPCDDYQWCENDVLLLAIITCSLVVSVTSFMASTHLYWDTCINQAVPWQPKS